VSRDRDHDRNAAYRRERRARARARRKAIRTRRLVGGLVLALLVAGVVASISGGSSASKTGSLGASTAARNHRSATRALAAARATAAPSPGSTPQTGPSGGSSALALATVSAGSLPQTHTYPSAGGARFRSLMAALWAGVVHDSVRNALAAFFPKGAYLQLKAIEGAGSDWTNRLVHDYALDIGAAHALLGRDAALARLVRVHVPTSYGHWISPGVCYNDDGYYEMPNARVVYSLGGRVRSFGIASMISWRGVWYVVHLGAVLRSTDSGVVDEPESGPGTSLYSGTC
jgi:hypothetical protein